jgi:hypothetical protein
MSARANKFWLPAALAVSVAVAGACAWGIYLAQAQAWPFGLTLALLAVAWVARQRSPVERRQQLSQATFYAGLLLGVTLLAPLGWTDALAGRSIGVFSGLLVAFCSNAIPKQASSARGLALRRSIGWAMVLGGLAQALCWLLLPLALANHAALLVLLIAVAYASARLFWFRFGPAQLPPSKP